MSYCRKSTQNSVRIYVQSITKTSLVDSHYKPIGVLDKKKTHIIDFNHLHPWAPTSVFVGNLLKNGKST